MRRNKKGSAPGLLKCPIGHHLIADHEIGRQVPGFQANLPPAGFILGQARRFAPPAHLDTAEERRRTARALPGLVVERVASGFLAGHLNTLRPRGGRCQCIGRGERHLPMHRPASSRDCSERIGETWASAFAFSRPKKRRR